MYPKKVANVHPKQMAATLYEIYNKFIGVNREDFLFQMHFLITLYLQYGPSIVDKRYMNYINYPPMRKDLKFLSAMYNISPRNRSPQNITLSSIVSCFPAIALDLIVDHPEIQRPVPIEIMEQRGFIGFKPEFRTFAWFHIIPISLKYIGFFKLILYHEFLEAEIMNACKVKYIMRTSFSKMDKIIETGQNMLRSEVYPEPFKNALLSKYVGEIPQTLLNSWSDNFDRLFPYHVETVREIFAQGP